MSNKEGTTNRLISIFIVINLMKIEIIHLKPNKIPNKHVNPLISSNYRPAIIESISQSHTKPNRTKLMITQNKQTPQFISVLTKQNKTMMGR